MFTCTLNNYTKYTKICIYYNLHTTVYCMYVINYLYPNVECRHGDQITWCYTLTSYDCYIKYNEEKCCKTCQKFYSTNPSKLCSVVT